ncbi:hypothetical protein H0H93_016151, partial [Arthromyces matolae]
KRKGGPRITVEDPIEDLADFERQFEEAKNCTTFSEDDLQQLLKYPSPIWLKFVERDQPAGTSYALKRGTGSMVSREQRDEALELHGACDRCVAKNCGHLCFYPGGALPCFRCGVDAAKCCFNGKGTRSSKGIGKGLAANIINAAKTTTTSATLPKASASVPPVAKAKRTGGTSKL